MSHREARDAAVMMVLAALPMLEESIVQSMESCDFALPEAPDEMVRTYMMKLIREECAEEIAKIRSSSAIKQFTEIHMLTLADFLMDGIDIFGPDERAAMAFLAKSS